MAPVTVVHSVNKQTNKQQQNSRSIRYQMLRRFAEAHLFFSFCSGNWDLMASAVFADVPTDKQKPLSFTGVLGPSDVLRTRAENSKTMADDPLTS